MSLPELAITFGVPGKFSKYNIEFNNLELLLENSKLLEEFKAYAIQDSVALYEAMLNAQETYAEKHSVDITTIVSTSSLSLKIYRTRFQEIDIPLLKGSIDTFVRRGYYGGFTECY